MNVSIHIVYPHQILFQETDRVSGVAVLVFWLVGYHLDNETNVI